MRESKKRLTNVTILGGMWMYEYMLVEQNV